MKLTTGMAAALFVAAGVSPSMANTRLVVNCFWPPQHFVCSEILPAWLDEVKEVTDGRVRGNIPPKSVAPPAEQLNSVEKGIVDAAIQFSGLIGNRVSGPLVAMNPFVGNYDSSAMSQALWETNQKFFPDEFENVTVLSQWAITPGELFSMTDTPINSVEELASRKIWALPGPLSKMASQLGAGVVSTPAVGSNEVISRGVVDGHLGLSGDGLKAFQLLSYTKSRTKFSKGLYTSSFSLVVNNEKWAEISPEDQAAIMEISGAKLGSTFGAKWDAVASSVYATFDDLGIAVVDADPAFEQAFVDAAASQVAAWVEKASAAGIDAGAALAFYQKRVAELSK